MIKKRQDSWANNEDVLLAEIVLRYIRNGKTQLEAFKEAGAKLSRTAAACGFRWNATLRKQYVEGIEIAKQNRRNQHSNATKSNEIFEGIESLDQAIGLLKKLKSHSDKQYLQDDERRELIHLREENEYLTDRLQDYEEAFTEIKRIWNWAKNKNEH